MSLYLPGHFAVSDLAQLDALIARDPFITLLTVNAQGVPDVSHLPVLYQRDGEAIRLRGHWARPNPQSRHLGTALAIVHGPHGYISPTWYRDPEQQVPTWNYAVAHLQGALQVFDDSARLQSVVSQLAEQFETALGSAWRFPQSAPARSDSLRGIVGFELAVERVDLKFKLNQNHPPANVQGAMVGLRQQGAAGAELADWMQRQIPGPG